MYACARVSIMHPFLQLCDYNNPNAKNDREVIKKKQRQSGYTTNTKPKLLK